MARRRPSSRRWATSTSPSTFSTQFGYLLTNEYGVEVTSNSYGNSDTTTTAIDAASQEADIIHAAFGERDDAGVLDRERRAGLRHGHLAAAGRGITVGASTQFGGTGWDSIKNPSQVPDNDVIEWSNRGPGANGRAGVDVVADGAYSPGDATLNTVIDGRGRVGRHGAARAARRRSPPAPPRSSTRRRRRRTGGAFPTRFAGAGDPQVVGARPGLRRVHPGLGLGRRRRGRQGRARAARAAVTPDGGGRRLPRHRVPAVPAADRAGRQRHADVQARAARGRGRSRTGSCSATARETFAVRRAASPRRARQLQRARLPDGPHRPRSRRTRTRTSWSSGRSTRTTSSTPDADYANDQAGGCSPTTGPTSTTTGGCGRTRTATASSTTPTTTQLEHRRLSDHRLREVGDREGRVRAVHATTARAQHAAWRSSATRPSGWPTASSSASSTERTRPSR